MATNYDYTSILVTYGQHNIYRLDTEEFGMHTTGWELNKTKTIKIKGKHKNYVKIKEQSLKQKRNEKL